MNLKLLLYLFEQMTGLKFNFHKVRYIWCCMMMKSNTEILVCSFASNILAYKIFKGASLWPQVACGGLGVD